MSEYQYHEWQALERPLTASEQKAVNGLSSHIDVTSSRAIVTYEWGSFKQKPLDVLAKYFDAYLYTANWGTRWLAFRFPSGLLDIVAIEGYCDEDHVNLETIGEVQVLKFEINREEGFNEGIDERGLLSTLGRLRDDLLLGDYRVLYLAWLKARELDSGYYQEDEDDPENYLNDSEPYLPVGLKQLTPALQAFIDFFEIDSFQVAAAAELSPSLSPVQAADLTRLVSHLSRQECDEFLLKMLNSEPGAVAALRKRLLSFEKPRVTPQPGSRSYGQLLKTAEKLSKAEFERQEADRHQKHAAEMQELAKRETQTWLEAEKTLASGYTALNYDYATTLLDKLRQLAQFQGTQPGFKSACAPWPKNTKAAARLSIAGKRKAGCKDVLSGRQCFC